MKYKSDKWYAIDNKGRMKVASQSNKQLVELWDQTNKRKDDAIPTVRGWIMDEAESRVGRKKFENWVDNDRSGSMKSLFK